MRLPAFWAGGYFIHGCLSHGEGLSVSLSDTIKREIVPAWRRMGVVDMLAFSMHGAIRLFFSCLMKLYGVQRISVGRTTGSLEQTEEMSRGKLSLE